MVVAFGCVEKKNLKKIYLGFETQMHLKPLLPLLFVVIGCYDGDGGGVAIVVACCTMVVVVAMVEGMKVGVDTKSKPVMNFYFFVKLHLFLSRTIFSYDSF